MSLPEKKVVVDDGFVTHGQFLISGSWKEEVIGQARGDIEGPGTTQIYLI